MFIDSDHAGDNQTSRSRTGFIIYMNMSLISSYSKKQSTIETSVFGTVFVSMKVGIETVHAIKYKLRIMGILISGPFYADGDKGTH